MLHPFFSYFGSKYRLAKNYPKPIYNTIIEPFAGSAGYSLLYPSSDIILYDNYEPVVELWKYLIKVTKKEVLELPLSYNNKDFSKENPVSQCNIPQEAKILIGFWLTESQTYSSEYPLSKSRGGNWTTKKRTMIANQLDKIRHWKADCKNYENIDCNIKSTWFVDPPYSQAGKRYKNNTIDYSNLAHWCKSRIGQTIVCEQKDANWLNFELFRKTANGSNKKYEEVLWIS